MLYLMIHSTHFSYGYMVLNDTLYGLLLSVNSRGSFKCTISQTAHTTVFLMSVGAHVGTRNSQVPIAPWLDPLPWTFNQCLYMREMFYEINPDGVLVEIKPGLTEYQVDLQLYQPMLYQSIISK